MGYISTILSRDVNTGNGVLDHVVASSTYSAAPTTVNQGFVIKRSAASAYDAIELTYSFAGGDATTSVLLRPWCYMGSQNAWVPTATQTIDYASASSVNPLRLTGLPTGANKLYLQVVSISGTAPTHVYMTVFGLTATGTNVDSGSINVQGANFADHTPRLVFGPFSADVTDVAAKAAAQAMAPPSVDKCWQTLQLHLRWSVAGTTAAGTPDAYVFLYYSADATTWGWLMWPIKYVDQSGDPADMAAYANMTSPEFPADARYFAIGIADYAAGTGGTFYVDLIAKA